MPQKLELPSAYSYHSLAKRQASLDTVAQDAYESNPFAASLLDNISDYDMATGLHSARVGRLTVAMLTKLGSPLEIVQLGSLASATHDNGQTWLPKPMLARKWPNELRPKYHRAMRHHPELGGRVLDAVAGPVGNDLAYIAREHHKVFTKAELPSVDSKEIVLWATAANDRTEAMIARPLHAYTDEAATYEDVVGSLDSQFPAWFIQLAVENHQQFYEGISPKNELTFRL